MADTLEAWGWTSFFAAQLSAPGELARVGRLINVDFSSLEVVGLFGQKTVVLSGNLRKFSLGRERPTVGDWLLLRDPDAAVPVVEAMLERRTLLSRKSPRGDVQPLAANVDRVFVTTTLNDDFSANRLERYLAMVLSTGAEPVIVVNKSDLSDAGAIQSARAALETRFPRVAVVFASAKDGQGLDELAACLGPGLTVALAGSSGVGKSSLVNGLLGRDAQRVAGIREEDGKGRHTTVSRALFRMAAGGLLVDSPGLRELQLTDVEEGVDRLFDDLVDLTLKCRFSNCAHENEPGCAVREALARGELDTARWESFLKLRGEAEAFEARNDAVKGRERLQKIKRIHKENRKKR